MRGNRQARADLPESANREQRALPVDRWHQRQNPAGRAGGIRGHNNRRGRQHLLRARNSGVTTGPSDAGPFWTDFLCSLTRRELREVKLVISNAHKGLKAAVATVSQHDCPPSSNDGETRPPRNHSSYTTAGDAIVGRYPDRTPQRSRRPLCWLSRIGLRNRF